MLTKEGANAFLKTLEEPPPHAVFILATTEPEKLPVTILSRCQRYAFRRIAIPVMIERMREIASAERISIEEGALSAIAYRADGGLRDALTMLEQAAAFSDGTVTAQTVDLAFGATGRNYAGVLLDQILARDAGAVLRTIEEASDAGTDMQVLMRSLIGEMRNLLVGRIDGELLARDLAPEDVDRTRERSARVTQAQVIRALRLLTEALATARSSGHPRLELESALLRYVLAAEDPTLDALSARVSALETAAPLSTAAAPPAETIAGQATPPPANEQTPAVHPQPQPPPVPTPASSGPVTIQKVRAAWESVVMKVESEKQSLRGELRRAMPDTIEGNTLVVKVPTAYSADVLKDNAALIQRALEEALATKLLLRFQAGSAAAGRPKGGVAARGAGRLQDGAQNPVQPAAKDDADELFSYLNERIK